MTAEGHAFTGMDREAWQALRQYAESELGTAVTAIRADVGLGALGMVTRDATRARTGPEGLAVDERWQAMRKRLVGAIDAIDQAMEMLRHARAADRARVGRPMPDRFLTKMTEGAQPNE